MKRDKNTNNVKPIHCKLVLVGDSGVGKTSIISSYLNNYQEKTNTTSVAYYSNKTIIIDEYKIDFEIWDTAGQEKYRSINSMFYRDANICIMVYDITRKDTFDSIKNYWYDSVLQKGKEGIIFGIVGNKSDLYIEEQVTEDEARQFSESINACFQLTSSRINSSIDDIFQMLGQKFIQSNDSLIRKTNSIILDKNSYKGRKNHGNCC